MLSAEERFLPKKRSKPTLQSSATEWEKKMIDGYDFVPTIGGRGQRHPHGLVGKVWEIKDPKTVRVGNCFLAGRLKKGDLFLCTGHSGDCFQNYCFVERYHGYEDKIIVVKYDLKKHWNFGSYGIGDAVEVELSVKQKVDILCQLNE